MKSAAVSMEVDILVLPLSIFDPTELRASLFSVPALAMLVAIVSRASLLSWIESANLECPLPRASET